MSAIDQPVKVLTGGGAATALMTLYSYWQSKKHNKQFIEPQLLTSLMRRATGKRSMKRKISLVEGWALHLAVGTMFNFLYTRVWKHLNVRPGKWSGLLMGAVNGTMAVGIWKLVFGLHPNPPKIDFRHFFRQLLVAHLVFGLTAGGILGRLLHVHSSR